MLNLNEIHHGDCLELMRHIPNGSVDMILCDLPYGTTACKWDTIIPFDKLWEQYERIIKPNGAIVLTAVQPFTSALVMSNPKLFKCEWIWHKTKATNYVKARQMPMKYHESVLVFGKKAVTYNPEMEVGKPYVKVTKSTASETAIFKDTRPVGSANVNHGERFPSSIQKIGNPNNGSLHPTQKPVALFEYLIRTYTNPGEVVLDNCAGSFTTAVAAENTGRRWICIEQEAKYCDIGRARLAARQPLLFAA